MYKQHDNLMTILHPLPTSVVAPGLFAVQSTVVNFWLIRTAKSLIAIDSGIFSPSLIGEMVKLGLKPSQVTDCFLTHSDYDHVGGIIHLPLARVHLSVFEEQMINGQTARKMRYHNPALTRPYHLLRDGEVIEIGGVKIKAIATPGHTPGSMCYLVNDQWLFTGDCLTLQNGQVKMFRVATGMDPVAQRASIKKIAKLTGIKLLCTAHFGISTDFATAMREWQN